MTPRLSELKLLLDNYERIKNNSTIVELFEQRIEKLLDEPIEKFDSNFSDIQKYKNFYDYSMNALVTGKPILYSLDSQLPPLHIVPWGQIDTPGVNLKKDQ